MATDPTDLDALTAEERSLRALLRDGMREGYTGNDICNLLEVIDALRTRLKMAEARYDTLALGIGYAEQPMGHHGVQAAEPATIIAAWKEMEARLAQGEGERDRLLHAALTAPDRAALVARERAREAVVEAAPRVLSWLDEIVHLDRVPRACGACGTPNASCDMDCANAAYMSRDTRALRAALDALAAAQETR